MTPEELSKVAKKYGVSESVARLSLDGLGVGISKGNMGRPVTRLSDPIPSEPLLKMAINRALGIRPTTDEEKLNKTERRYLEWLRGQGDLWIGVQCITLKIGHDTRYCPDFWALDKDGLRAIDVKASWDKGLNPRIEEDSHVKIKVCARLFPFIRFVVAWESGKVWMHREMKV